MDTTVTPLAIDPRGCGCTECMIGEYVPLERATHQQIAEMLRGEILNHTSATFDVSVAYTVGGYEGTLLGAVPREVVVSSHDLSWTIDPAELPQLFIAL